MPVRYSSGHDDSRRNRPAMGSNIKRRFDSLSSRSELILSSDVMWILALAIPVAGVAVLFVWKRRQERAVHEFAQQVWQLTREAGAPGRIGLEGQPGGLSQLGSAVNQLLENL